MRKPGSLFLAVLIGVLLAGTLTSCEEFFTTSWGTWAARDKDELASNINPSNAADLVKGAKNDPDLSLALLKKISETIGDTNDPDALLALRQGALDAAANASGLVPALMKALGEITKDGAENADVIGIVSDTLNSLGNLGNTAGYLYAILEDGGDYGGLSSGSLVFGAAMLAAADAKDAVNLGYDNTPEEYFNELQGKTLEDVKDEGLFQNTILAMEIALKLTDVEGELGKILGELGLKEGP